MKKITALFLGLLLSASCAFAVEPSSADQKWLQVVEKMVLKGQNTVSTQNEGRVSLLKDWASKNGYSTKVTKTGPGFAIELTVKKSDKALAQK